MQFNRIPTSAISGVAVSGALLAGCAQNPELIFSHDSVTAAQADGFIYDEVNVRTSPQRIDDEAHSNSCGRTDKAVILQSVDIAISDGIGSDSNGDWIGVKPEYLPSDITENCISHYGGMLWIAKKYVQAEITKVAQPNTAVNER